MMKLKDDFSIIDCALLHVVLQYMYIIPILLIKDIFVIYNDI